MLMETSCFSSDVLSEDELGRFSTPLALVAIRKRGGGSKERLSELQIEPIHFVPLRSGPKQGFKVQTLSPPHVNRHSFNSSLRNISRLIEKLGYHKLFIRQTMIPVSPVRAF